MIWTARQKAVESSWYHVDKDSTEEDPWETSALLPAWGLRKKKSDD